MNLSMTAMRLMARTVPFGNRLCALCGRRAWRFLPYRDGARSRSPLMAALGMVGSDIENFSCPHCEAHDRERHLYLYLKASGWLSAMRGKSILHFAPEGQLSMRIADQEPLIYIQCDLRPNAPGVRAIDMLSMDVPSGTIDLVIANHVLEHVASDRRALAEIHRVLRPGGHAILQTPYCRMLHATWEDAGIVDPAARLQAFGQEDHVRLYGRDIFDRFAAAGFIPRVSRHADLLPQVDERTSGVNREEPFFLFQRE